MPEWVGEKYQRIVDVASDLAFEQGWGGLSLRRVAARAELSLGTVTYHFASKEELLEACLDRLYAELAGQRDRFVSAALEARSLEDLIPRLISEMFYFGRQHHRLLRLRMMTLLSAGKLSTSRLELFHEPMLEMTAQALAASSALDIDAARLTMQSFVFLVARYAVMSDEELRALCPYAADTSRACADVVDHLVDLATIWVTAPRPHE